MTIYKYQIEYTKRPFMELRDCDTDSPFSPEELMQIVKALGLCNCPREQVAVLMLNTRLKVIGVEIVSMGTECATEVQPKFVYSCAIKHGASGVILVHNHPSGDPTPSADDIKATERIMKGGKILGIKLVDHIIVADDKFVSLQQKGVIK